MASTKDLLAVAEGILAESSPVSPLTVTTDPILDDGIKDVHVPNAYVNQVLGFSEALNESSDPEKKQKLMPAFEPITEEIILKERLETLVESLKELLSEAKNVTEEMTSAGMIGVNLAAKKKKKNGPRRRN